MTAAIIALLFMMVFADTLTCAADQTVIPVWPEEVPGEAAAKPESVEPDKGDDVIRISNVSIPTLELFPVNRNQPTPFVIVCPGGAYRILSYNYEGTEAAEWLNSIGVSAAVLKYRVPDNRSGALLDAMQAVKLARENTQAWNIAPGKLGMLGFSAGGHLTASCSSSDNRPDFTILIYPAYLNRENSEDLVDEIIIDSDTPPAFIVQTMDDLKYYQSAFAYSWSMQKAKRPIELHLFAKGGHGYGLRPRGEHPVSQWPKLCESWMRETGVLEKK